MSRKGLSMRNVREILRLRFGVGLSADNVAKSCKISKATVLTYEKRSIYLLPLWVQAAIPMPKACSIWAWRVGLIHM